MLDCSEMDLFVPLLPLHFAFLSDLVFCDFLSGRLGSFSAYPRFLHTPSLLLLCFSLLFFAMLPNQFHKIPLCNVYRNLLHPPFLALHPA